MSETERYVRRASRGLWGKKAHEVRAELRGHIEGRVLEFRAGGLGQAEAIRQTLRELGAPERVRAGMGQVYLLPTLARSGALALIGAVLAASLITQGIAQVQAFDKNPPGLPEVAPYLRLSDLQQKLQEAGLSTQLQNGYFSVRLENGRQILRLPLRAGNGPNYGADELIRRQSDLYLRSDVLLGALAKTGASVRLDGLVNPTLFINGHGIKLGTTEKPFDASAYFTGRLFDQLNREGQANVRSQWTTEAGVPYDLSVQGQPGDLFAILFVIPRPKIINSAGNLVTINPVGALQLAQLDAEGQLHFRLPVNQLRFLGSPKAVVDATSTATIDTSPAVLLKLNRQIGQGGQAIYEIVPASNLSVPR